MPIALIGLVDRVEPERRGRVMSMAKRLQRSRDEKLIGGVCGGIADYFELDPVLVRAAFVLFALFGGTGLLLYVVLWVIMPLTSPPPSSA